MQLVQEIELSDGDFRRFAGLVYAASGIHLTEQKKELLRARLRKRLRALGLQSFHDYFGVVTAEGAEGELKALLDVVSTNKTEFFREASQFTHLCGPALEAWRQGGGPARGPLRVWSAASSSGEECYSLGMVLSEALRGGEDFKILGTDISTRMLDRALAGRYEERHVMAVPSNYREKYLQAPGAPGEDWQVGPQLRARTAFGRVNLNEGALPFSRDMDIIFCRNVMIYFDRPTQEALVAKLSAALAPGGWLYTGLSESLLAIRHGLRTMAPSIYQKPA